MSQKSLMFLLIALATVGCQRGDPNCRDRVYMHEYGVPMGSNHWIKCGRTGHVLTTLSDGVCLKQCYSNGLLHGECTYSYPNSKQTRQADIYCNDVLQSQILYSPSGMPRQSFVFTTPETYTLTTWYNNGHPKCIEKYENGMLVEGNYYNIHNERDSWVYDGVGERHSRDDNGNFLSVDEFRGGEHVFSTTYYPNQSPKDMTPYAQGVIHGVRKTYHPDGSPMTTETWSEGQQSGVTVVFQNGEKHSEVPYLANKKNGLERRFRDGSVVTQEITWYNDQMHGPCYTYSNDSVQTDWFHNGRMTTRSNYESFAIPKVH